MSKCELIFRPLEGWPRDFTAGRKLRPFQQRNLGENLHFLSRELGFLEASAAAVQVAFDERDISVSTGVPRSDRNPAHPGVIVAADTKHGALKWVCDDCGRWQDNIRAIALTLERLRLADRYGVTRRGEQYAGWKMLPGPITLSASAGNSAMSIDEAARFVASVCGNVTAGPILEARSWWEAAYKSAAKRLHPDVSRDAAGWKKLQDAKQLLDGLHNR